jgi:hypothetical protein
LSLKNWVIKVNSRVIKVFSRDVVIRTGDYLVLYPGNEELDETKAGTDGVIYVYVEDLRLPSTDCLLGLKDSQGRWADVLVWSNQDGRFSRLSEEEFKKVVEEGCWEIGGSVPTESDCVDSSRVSGSQVIARRGQDDTNSSRDWVILDTPTIGCKNDTRPELEIENFSIEGNPFLLGEEKARVSFSANAPVKVRLVIFNLSGRHVKTIEVSFPPSEGVEVEWEGRDASGGFVPVGVYVCHLEAKDVVSGDAFQKVFTVVAGRELH